MIKSINISKNGSKRPLATCERYNMVSNGALGIIMTITASTISPRYSPWNIGDSLKHLDKLLPQILDFHTHNMQ
jgi:hypothetical protein